MAKRTTAKATYIVKGYKRLHGWDPGEDGYQVSVLKDGRKIGTFGMEANGGCEHFDMDNTLYKELVKHAHEALGKMDEYKNPEADWSHSSVASEYCEQLVNEAEDLKDRRRWSKKKTLFNLSGDEKNIFGRYAFHRTITAPYSPKVHQHLLKKYGKKLVEIYNQQGAIIVVSVKDKEQKKKWDALNAM